MPAPNKYTATLTKIAKQCQANYSSDDKKLFDKAPPGTTAPVYHLGRVYKLDDAGSFALVQNQITFLDCKARNGRSFNDDEKQFLINLYEAMWWGSRLLGYREAGELANAYVNGNGRPVTLAPQVYQESAIVKTTQPLMREVISEHFERAETPLTIKSIDPAVRQKIAKLRRNKRFVQLTDGELYANGILKAEENNPRLKFADNRFALQAFAKLAQQSSTVKTVEVTWKVENLYDFASYETKPDDLSTVPVVFPPSKSKSPQEVQRLLAEIFPSYMKLDGRYSDRMVLPDGLSKYMVEQGIAKEFTYTASWSERLTVTPQAPKQTERAKR